MNRPRRTVGIFVFEDVEVLDFAGPFEVFSRCRLSGGLEARRSDDSGPFDVFTVARDRAPVRATGGLMVTPHYGFSDVPHLDVLLIPGGFGTRPLRDDTAVLAWIAEAAERAELVTSVCTGSLLLARAGLLKGRRATTHWGAFDLLAEEPGVEVDRESRWVEDGVISSAGVAAGIDMAFAVIEKFHGREVADETARYIEYPRHRADERRY